MHLSYTVCQICHCKAEYSPGIQSSLQAKRNIPIQNYSWKISSALTVVKSKTQHQPSNVTLNIFLDTSLIAMGVMYLDFCSPTASYSLNWRDMYLMDGLLGG